MNTVFERQRQSPISIIILNLVLAVCGFSACQTEKDEDTSTPGSSPTVSVLDPKALSNGGPAVRFFIDLVNAKQHVVGTVLPLKADSGEIVINGWAADHKNKKAAAGVFVTVDDKTDIPASYGEARPDVANLFKEPNYSNSGFTVKVPLAGLAKGKHTLTFKVASSDRKEYFVPEQRMEIDLQ